MPAPNRRQPRKLLQLSRSPVAGRLAVVNHFKRAMEYPGASGFLSSKIWRWICSYLKYVLECKFPFQHYRDPKNNGVYRLTPAAGSELIRIGIAGDWATGTTEANRIAGLIDDTRPDITIHLGDVYYVGDTEEIEENCLGKSMHGFAGVTWPKGTQGSFALNGNHEMYANGKPYFKTFLTTLGMTGQPEGQLASFFCLETEHWRILAIDTGYNSVGWPILGVLPVLKEIPFIGGDCRLEGKLIEWVRKVIQPQENHKATLLLSHHQYFSAFPELSYHKPAKQLAQYFQGQEIVWLWGHEHRLGIYDKFTTPEGVTFYGRCIGHGGMPVEMATPDSSKAPLKLYDHRSHKLDDDTDVGENGFVSLTIQGAVLTLDYRDIKNTLLLSEKFTAGADGNLTYSFDDPGIFKSPE